MTNYFYIYFKFTKILNTFSSIPLTGHASTSKVSVCLSEFCVTVSDSWGIEELNFNLTWTLIRLIYAGNVSPQLKTMLLMMRIKKISIRLEKLTVDGVKDEQDFGLEDEVTEDSTEQ
jgi:hypothetical protein